MAFNDSAAIFVIMCLLSFLPFLAVAASSFLKFSVVLAILRNAIGGQQVPSAALCSVLAFALSLQVMVPVIDNVVAELSIEFEHPRLRSKQGRDLSHWRQVVKKGVAPLEEFLRRHSHSRERVFFASGRSIPKEQMVDNVEGESFLSLLPAFLISELDEAFQIGLIIMLPFLLIDLLIANVLMALGMMMVSPTTISFPLKLFTFILADGWFQLSQGLIKGY